MYRYFRRDPYFMLKYYLYNWMLLGVFCVALELGFGRLNEFNMAALWLGGVLLFVLPKFSLIYLSSLYFLALFFFGQNTSFSPTALWLTPAGMLAGAVSAAVMHNAAHGNLRPRWSNRFWGELCGLLQVTGFAGWTVSHLIHHSSPDHPEKDPHPPGNLSFTQFANSMGTMMKENITAKYFEIMGRNQKTVRIWSAILFLLPFTRYLRVLFVMLLLGPVGFVFFYIPFKVVNALIYIDFNYRTHRPTQDGDFEVVNLNHNLWYKFLNTISFGSYFHKNHHMQPSVFDPRHVTRVGTEPLVTYSSRGANPRLVVVDRE